MNQVIADFIENNADRMISDGAIHDDLATIRRTLADPAQWCTAWMAIGDRYEELAGAALAAGSHLTAAERLWRGALACHFGQGYFTESRPDLRARASSRRQELFRRAAPMFSPPLERLEVPFESITMPGYLALPSGAGAQATKPGCVILFGGLDTTKEDAFEFSRYFLQRGVATFAFDGPGQGEVFEHMKARMDFERVVGAVLDRLGDRADLDSGRIGVVGRSTGGHWACRAAALEPRIRAVAAWGLIYDLHAFGSMPKEVRARFVRAAGVQGDAEAADFFSGYDLAPYAARIRCPLMVAQGGRDPLSPPGGEKRLMSEAPGAEELLLFPESGHCAHDKAHILKPAIADFMQRHLRDSANA